MKERIRVGAKPKKVRQYEAMLRHPDMIRLLNCPSDIHHILDKVAYYPEAAVLRRILNARLRRLRIREAFV